MKATIAEGGRLVVPAEFRRQLGMQPGTEVVIDIDDGALRIRTFADILARVQANVRRYVPEDVSLVDELIAERRAEAAKE
jgi:AbrB family looped-hinge helix DNA binding protein